MIYLAKMVDLLEGMDNCKGIFRFPIGVDPSYNDIHAHILTVLDDKGNRVDNYRYENLYGARLYQDDQYIALHVVMKEHWKLYDYLLYGGVVPANNELVLKANNVRSIRFKLEKNEYFIFDNENTDKDEYFDYYTLAGILLNTEADTDTKTGCWCIDGNILTVRATDCNVLYRITDTKEFKALLAKLKTMGLYY